ncbi:MAG: hypothetical protein JSW08_00420 [archaeon]|nr:MAG: hypothetical protein JSW08_00420 [archaeon]
MKEISYYIERIIFWMIVAIVLRDIINLELWWIGLIGIGFVVWDYINDYKKTKQMKGGKDNGTT